MNEPTTPPKALPPGHPGHASNEPIPSISLQALLQRRDAAVERLQTIFQAVKEYGEIGDALAMVIKQGDHEYTSNAGYKFRASFDRHSSDGVGTPCWLTKATACVDASLWDLLLDGSGLRTFLDAAARREWDQQIEKGETPPLTADNIRATFAALHSHRGEFFERGVVGVFRSLSWEFRTNLPRMFGKRIIVGCLTDSCGHPCQRASDSLDDLLRAFHVLDGKPEPDHRSGVRSRLWAHRDRKALLEDPYLSIRIFKNGNGHVALLRQDLVEELNRIIARAFPNALPPVRE
jgi:hypothetical protein